MSEPPVVPTSPPTRRPWLPWLTAGVAALVVVASGLFVARNTDSRNRAVPVSAELASLQQACGQWRTAYANSSAPTAAWCNAMVGWMSAQTTSGRMMGPMMWGDVDLMHDTCPLWMAAAPDVSGSASTASAWCDAMVDWMSQNDGPWTHMMGR